MCIYGTMILLFQRVQRQRLESVFPDLQLLFHRNVTVVTICAEAESVFPDLQLLFHRNVTVVIICAEAESVFPDLLWLFHSNK